MTPTQVDELAQALHALFTVSNRWERALPSTQELYRKGVVLVLGKASPGPIQFGVGDPRATEIALDAEREQHQARLEVITGLRKAWDIGPTVFDAELVRIGEYKEEKLRAAERARDEQESALSAIRDALDVPASVEDVHLHGYAREARSGQLKEKARADRAEAARLEEERSRKNAVLRAEHAADRIAALDKALSAADHLYAATLIAQDEDAQRLAARREYRAARRAALDATQPKDSTSGEPAVPPNGNTEGPSDESRSSPAGCSGLSAGYAQLRKDVTTLATLLNVFSWEPSQRIDLKSIIQRGQASTEKARGDV